MPVWGLAKVSRLFQWRHAGSLRLWMSVYAVSILGSYIFNSYARPYVSSINISISLSMSMSIRRSILFSALFLSLLHSLPLSLRLVSAEAAVISEHSAAFYLFVDCFVAHNWVNNGSSPSHPSPLYPMTSYYCCCPLLFAVCVCPFTSQVAAHNTKRNSLTKTIYLAVELVTDAPRLQLQHPLPRIPPFSSIARFDSVCQWLLAWGWARISLSASICCCSCFPASFIYAF